MMENRKIEFERCPVCGEEKERFIPNVFGTGIVIPRNCKCRSKEIEAEQRAAKAREHKMLVDRNTDICFGNRKMRKEWTFANDDGNTAKMDVARSYVKKWDEMFRNHQGLLLWGKPGVGKTYMAACIANALLEKEKQVLMQDFTTISNVSVFDSQEYFNSFEKYSLLILDDLGSERQSEFSIQNVFDVINRRWESGKPMIVTTNLKLSDLKQPKDIQHERIYDRILQCCTPVYIDGESERKKAAEENNEVAIRLLRDGTSHKEEGGDSDVSDDRE